jgi:hypothetical protein
MAVTSSGPRMPYAGMYVQVKFRKDCMKPSPFKVLFQTGTLAREATSWDAQWFGNYE